jgi:hypothetical protein
LLGLVGDCPDEQPAAAEE